MGDCSRCVQDTIKEFGGLDIIIANAGWTRFSDFADLGSMSDEEWTKCWNTNVLGPKKFVQEALPTFKKNPEGGVVIITGSIAGQSIGGSSMPYSVTKAAQIHMMKCVAKTQGPTLRINAVLPGLLLTDWGNQYGEERINALKEAAALKTVVCTGAGASPSTYADSMSCRPNLMIALTCLLPSLRISPSPARPSLLVCLAQMSAPLKSVTKPTSRFGTQRRQYVAYGYCRSSNVMKSITFRYHYTFALIRYLYIRYVVVIAAQATPTFRGAVFQHQPSKLSLRSEIQ